jgi:hypothetical protein
MIFECNGVRHDSDNLIVFKTGDDYIPLIYMTRDHSRVFVARVERWEGMAVRQADAPEIKGLAARFGIEDLKRALR